MHIFCPVVPQPLPMPAYVPAYVLAIDPGMKCLGWALFVHGLLMRCGVSRSKGKTIGQCAEDHIHNLNALGLPPDLHGVVERPKIYPLAQQKGDQNDLIAIACVGAEVAGRFARVGSTSYVYPDGWKGQMSKPVSHRRIKRRLDCGTADSPETRVMNTLPKAKTIRHNGMDAIGIGLNEVGRRA